MKKIGLLFLAVAVMCACGDKDKGNDEPKIKGGTYNGAVVADLNDGSPQFTKEDVSVEVTDNKNGTVNIKMLSVKFADVMPVAIDITIPGITATKTAQGHSLSGNNIVPLAMGGPNSEYIITNFTGNLTDETLSFGMTCKGYSLTYTGTAVTE